MIESNDQDWGLCDHGLVGREFDDDAEEDYGDAWDEFDEQDDDDDEWPTSDSPPPHMTGDEPGR